MTSQEYANEVIKTNIKLGYTPEQIMSDLKAAAQRHLKNQLKVLDGAQNMFDQLPTKQAIKLVESI
jgi:hypothetical protein